MYTVSGITIGCKGFAGSAVKYAGATPELAGYIVNEDCVNNMETDTYALLAMLDSVNVKGSSSDTLPDTMCIDHRYRSALSAALTGLKTIRPLSKPTASKICSVRSGPQSSVTILTWNVSS
jgi:hypothetical protein